MGQGERAWNAKQDGCRISYLDELAAVEHEAGFVRGRHFLTWGQEVAQLKRNNRYDEALELLVEIITATETERATERRHAPLRAEHLGVRELRVRETPSAWTEHAAIIYRRLGDLQSEIAIIDPVGRARWLA